jgi:hypothetical protein
MESMHELVELERINFAPIPSIELHAELAEGFAQIADGVAKPISSVDGCPARAEIPGASPGPALRQRRRAAGSWC